jgi:hypothetical protein
MVHCNLIQLKLLMLLELKPRHSYASDLNFSLLACHLKSFSLSSSVYVGMSLVQGWATFLIFFQKIKGVHTEIIRKVHVN